MSVDVELDIVDLDAKELYADSNVKTVVYALASTVVNVVMVTMVVDVNLPTAAGYACTGAVVWESITARVSMVTLDGTVTELSARETVTGEDIVGLMTNARAEKDTMDQTANMRHVGLGVQRVRGAQVRVYAGVGVQLTDGYVSVQSGLYMHVTDNYRITPKSHGD